MRLFRHATAQSRLLAVFLFACMLASPALSQAVIGTYEGSAPGDQLGRVVISVPDVDGDGRADIACGSPMRETPAGWAAGAVEIRCGATGATLLMIEGTLAGSRFGAALGLADVDNDGRLDLIVGAPLYDGPAGVAAGRVQVFALPSATLLLTIEGPAAGDRFGAALAGVGDANGDGRDDIAVGAPFNDASGANAGRLSIHSGDGGSMLGVFFGEAPGDQLGASVAFAGDVNGDGYGDVIAGAPFHDGPLGEDAGRAYLLGHTAAQISFCDGPSARAQFGSAVLGAFDVDGNGTMDVIVAAEAANGSAGSYAGLIMACSAPSFGVLWVVEGIQAGGRFGSALALVGDQDGDLQPEIAVGARAIDLPGAGRDAGVVHVLKGTNGTLLFTVEGNGPGDQLGIALDSRGDIDLDGRQELLVGASFASGVAGAEAGQIRALSFEVPSGRRIRGYFAGPSPVQVRAIDVDGDGDLDLAIICAGDNTLRILWNGNHESSGAHFATGIFDDLAPTIVVLEPSASPVSLAAAQVDGDLLAEFAIGRANGTVQIVDGHGSTIAPEFTPLSTLIVADPSPAPTAIIAAAFVSQGPTIALAVAIAGDLSHPGQLRIISDPLGAALLGAPIISAGKWSHLETADLDGDGRLDIILANASAGASGGIHVVLGSTLLPSGTIENVGFMPKFVAVGALDSDLRRDDVIVAGLGSPAGVAVLPNFRSGVGFEPPVPITGFPDAKSATLWRRSPDHRDAVVADVFGNLFLLAGWNGGGFSQTQSLAAGSGVSDLLAAPLIANGTSPVCDGDVLIALASSDNAVRIIRQAQQAIAEVVVGTGCPAYDPVARIGITGTPVLGDSSFGITLAAASPLAPAFFAVQVSLQPGLAPFIVPVEGCGFIYYGGEIVFFETTTSAAGTSHFPVPLPVEPALLCIEFGVTWIVQDSGPVGGAFTFSDSMIIQFGETF